MDRRRFLKTTVIGAAAGLMRPDGNSAVLEIEQKPVVLEIQAAPKAAITALFKQFGGLQHFIKTDLANATVILKPNLCLPQPSERGITTSPDLLAELCTYLSANGVGKIIIVDHTLQEKSVRSQQFELSSFAQQNPNVKFLLANQQRFYLPTHVAGKQLKQTEILKLLQRADLCINLPTAKHHSATHVSLSMKNLMGLIWDRSVFHTGMDLHQAIADLATAIRPGLNILDASRILLNGGPTGPGPILTENRYFAAIDPVALDSVVVSRYSFGGRNITARDVRHLEAAHQLGIGEIDLTKIDLKQIQS
ncbi:DUF362 domain-containing protein [candidate division KSB1 bacterium]|nr:DUF362 domain-containing protein [candidate division KSB1 bacterium]